MKFRKIQMRYLIWCLIVLTGLCACKRVSSNNELPTGKYELLGLIDGEKSIELNMKVGSDGNVKGNYTVKKDNSVYEFKGTVFDNDKVTLYVSNPNGGGEDIETWNLTAETDAEDIILKGTITDNKGKTKKVVVSNDSFNLTKAPSVSKDGAKEEAVAAKAPSGPRKLKATYQSGGTEALVEPQAGTDYKPSYLFNGNNSKSWQIYPSIAEYYGSSATTVYAKLEGNVLDEVQVYNGYQKSKDLYEKNSRPRRIYIALVGSDGSEMTIFDGNLKDKMGAQTVASNLDLPISGGDRVKIQIFPYDIYEGWKYEDLCLSGVVFKGK